MDFSPAPTQSTGIRAFRLCLRILVVAGFVFVFGTVSELLLPTGFFGIIYGSAIVRYGLAAGLTWYLLRVGGMVLKSWGDPVMKVRRFVCVGLLLFLAMLIAVTLLNTSQWEESVPGDVWQALREPSTATLYSIGKRVRKFEMDKSGNPVPVTSSGETFHDYKVLGKIALTGKEAAAAEGAFRYALDWPDGMMRMNCFDPRHALRVTSGGHEYDFLLCYECHGIVCYRDGQAIFSRTTSGSSKRLNALLTEAKIPLAP